MNRMAGFDSIDKCKPLMTAWLRQNGRGLPAVVPTKAEAEAIRLKLLRAIERRIIANSRATATKTGVRNGPYLSTSLDDELERGRDADVIKIFVGYILILAYVVMSVSSFDCDMVQSRILVGVASVVTVVLGVTGGIGLAALCGIRMTSAAQSVLPLFLLGIGLNDVFVLVHCFPTAAAGSPAGPAAEPAAEVMARFMSDVGPSVTLTSWTNFGVFMIASLIPVPLVQVGTGLVISLFVLNKTKNETKNEIDKKQTIATANKP